MLPVVPVTVVAFVKIGFLLVPMLVPAVSATEEADSVPDVWVIAPEVVLTTMLPPAPGTFMPPAMIIGAREKRLNESPLPALDAPNVEVVLFMLIVTLPPLELALRLEANVRTLMSFAAVSVSD